MPRFDDAASVLSRGSRMSAHSSARSARSARSRGGSGRRRAPGQQQAPAQQQQQQQAHPQQQRAAARGAGGDGGGGNRELESRIEAEAQRCAAMEQQLEAMVREAARAAARAREESERRADAAAALEAHVASLRREQATTQGRLRVLQQQHGEATRVLQHVGRAVDEKHVLLAAHFVPRTRFADDGGVDAAGASASVLPPALAAALASLETLCEDEDEDGESGGGGGGGDAAPVVVSPTGGGGRCGVRGKGGGWGTLKDRVREWWDAAAPEGQPPGPAAGLLAKRDADSLLEPRFLNSMPPVGGGPEEFRKGDVVFGQGAKATKMYRIVRGGVKLIVHGKVSSALTVGDFFGELSFFYPTNRTATAIAVRPTLLHGISRQAAARLATAYPNQHGILKRLAARRMKAYVTGTLLRRCEGLRGYADDAAFADKVARHMHARCLDRWTPVYEQGSVGDCVFFPVTGEYESTVDGVRAGLVRDSFFGAASLVTGCRREATVSTRTPALVVALEARGFAKLAVFAPALHTLLSETAARQQAYLTMYREFYLRAGFLSRCRGGMDADGGGGEGGGGSGGGGGGGGVGGEPPPLARLLQQHSKRLVLAPGEEVSDLADGDCYFVASGAVCVALHPEDDDGGGGGRGARSVHALQGRGGAALQETAAFRRGSMRKRGGELVVNSWASPVAALRNAAEAVPVPAAATARGEEDGDEAEAAAAAAAAAERAAAVAAGTVVLYRLKKAGVLQLLAETREGDLPEFEPVATQPPWATGSTSAVHAYLAQTRHELRTLQDAVVSGGGGGDAAAYDTSSKEVLERRRFEASRSAHTPHHVPAPPAAAERLGLLRGGGGGGGGGSPEVLGSASPPTLPKSPVPPLSQQSCRRRVLMLASP